MTCLQPSLPTMHPVLMWASSSSGCVSAACSWYATRSSGLRSETGSKALRNVGNYQLLAVIEAKQVRLCCLRLLQDAVLVLRPL